ncbi:MAG: hypothetical protein ACRDE2_07410, partial [Chitinophagaceae bacterium]
TCIVIFYLFLSPVCRAQDAPIYSQFTTEAFRAQFNPALIKWSILNNIKESLPNADNQYDFQSAFWPMELILYKTPYIQERLAYAFSKADSCTSDFQRGLVEVSYTNWPNTFRKQVTSLMKHTDSPKVFAICAEYLWRGGKYPEEKNKILTLMDQKFSALKDNPVLMMLKQRLTVSGDPVLPPLADIFSEQFAPGLTVIYSFQRQDRDYPGLVIVRKPDGSFVRDSSGKIFSVSQLARSITDLPFYLTNGNTPQGIYRMSGFAVSTSRFIGPTPNIQLSMPYEIPVDSFLISPAPGDTNWNMVPYKDLLPVSWQQYEPVYQSYYAGEGGRTAIIAHGTTIDQDYYKGQIYFPQTPSQGCLCAHEVWSPETGERLESDQQKLDDAVRQAGNGIGYAVVIDLGNKKSPVKIEEILSYIQEAEKQL